MTIANSLLLDVEAFLSRTGMGAGSLGKRSVNNSAMVKCLRLGRASKPETEDKIRQFMSEYVPVAREAKTAPKPVRARASSKPASGYRTPAAYAPLAKEMGVHVYTRPDGISLPFLPSLYGERGS